MCDTDKARGTCFDTSNLKCRGPAIGDLRDGKGRRDLEEKAFTSLNVTAYIRYVGECDVGPHPAEVAVHLSQAGRRSTKKAARPVNRKTKAGDTQSMIFQCESLVVV